MNLPYTKSKYGLFTSESWLRLIKIQNGKATVVIISKIKKIHSCREILARCVNLCLGKASSRASHFLPVTLLLPSTSDSQNTDRRFL